MTKPNKPMRVRVKIVKPGTPYTLSIEEGTVKNCREIRGDYYYYIKLDNYKKGIAQVHADNVEFI